MNEKRRRWIPLVIPILLLLLIGSSILFHTVGRPAIERRHGQAVLQAAKMHEEERLTASEKVAEPAPAETTPPPPPTVANVPPPPSSPARMAIEGTIYRPDGQPAPRAQVDVFILQAGRHSRIRTTTDEKGAFAAECPAHARILVTAHARGTGRSITSIPDAEALAGRTDFGMQLRPETVAAGTLETADGTPVAGAVLRFHPFRMGSSNPESDNNWNILAFALPSDPAWDTECWNQLFLTDCEATTSETGEFRAPSLLSGIHYVVEVNGERLPLSTTKKNAEPFRLRLSR